MRTTLGRTKDTQGFRQHFNQMLHSSSQRDKLTTFLTGSVKEMNITNVGEQVWHRKLEGGSQVIQGVDAPGAGIAGVWRRCGTQLDREKTKNREGGYDRGGGEVCGCFRNLNWGWVGGNNSAKRHDGCEIQLLEGEDTHTLLLADHLLKQDG